MDIHAAEARKIERGPWKQEAVGDNDQDVGAPSCQIRAIRFSLEGLRLGKRNAMGLRQLLDGAGGHLATSALGPVWLRQDTYDSVGRLEQRLQSRQGKLRRSRECNAEPRCVIRVHWLANGGPRGQKPRLLPAAERGQERVLREKRRPATFRQ